MATKKKTSLTDTLASAVSSATKKKTASSKKTSTKTTANNKTQKKVNILMIILIVVIIIAIILTTVVFREEIAVAIKNLGGNGDNGNGGQSGNRSVLSGGTAVVIPDELGDIGMEIHYIDVGQGDSIVVRFPDGKDMIIDAGSTPDSTANTNKFLNYLESIEIDYFDYMIMTHPDSDHINMIDNVLDTYDVYNVYMNDYDVEGVKIDNTVKDKVIAEGATVTYFDEDGDIYEIEGDDYLVTIYAPGYERFMKNGIPVDNDTSPIITIEYKTRTFLFVGDAEEEVESWFMEEYSDIDLDCDVLKVGHHGSKSSTSVKFLNFINAEFAVISSSTNNTYYHPHPVTMDNLLDKGIITYRTSRHGSIILYVDVLGEFAFGVENEVPPDNNKYRLPERMIIAVEDED